MTTFADQLGAREWVSQYAIKTVGVVIHVDGVPSNPDGDVVVKMKDLESTTTFFTRTADHPAIGTFETILQSGDTDVPGIYQLEWSYVLNTVAQEFVSVIEVGESSPAWDSLQPEVQPLAEAAWLRFADMFDSPYGGPHLQVYFQSNFNRNRVAQLLRLAVGTLNTVAQPRSSYSVDAGVEPPFPTTEWGSLLERSLYIEMLRHLIRSYVEQPSPQNVTISRLDRRDYYDRWKQVLQDELATFEKQLDHFKITQMSLGGGVRVLVSGGVYGTYGPTRLSHSAAARPRYWYQWH